MKDGTFETFRDFLYREHLPLVEFIARKFANKLPPNVSFDELYQWGSLGLLDACEKFDPVRNAQNHFKTYAEHRIRGNILDQLRAQDTVSRHGRDQEKLITEAAAEVEVETGRRATDEAIAKRLNVSVQEVHLMKLRSAGRLMIAFDGGDGRADEFTAADREALLASNANRGDLTAKIEAMQKLKRAVSGHSQLARASFYLYCVWGLNLKEIAEVFGFTESRASQLVSNVRLGIRAREDN